jgi:uncharacterized protein (TIGR01244 family)
MQKVPLGAGFFVSGQLTPADIDTLAADGIAAVVCNRPDGEEPGQPAAADIERACRAHGLPFHHLPMGGAGLPADHVDRLAAIIRDTDGPVLAYCRSGQRSAWLYSQLPAGKKPTDPA